MKNNLLLVFSTILAVMMLFSCNGSGTQISNDAKAGAAFDLPTVKHAIDSNNHSFSTMLAKGDSIGISNLYALDAKFMDAGAPAVVGRTAIKSLMSGFIKSGASRVDFKTIDVFGCDSLVAEEGELKLYAGAKEIAEDKYIVLWKKEEGSWKIFRDISNSNLPPLSAK